MTMPRGRPKNITKQFGVRTRILTFRVTEKEHAFMVEQAKIDNRYTTSLGAWMRWKLGLTQSAYNLYAYEPDTTVGEGDDNDGR